MALVIPVPNVSIPVVRVVTVFRSLFAIAGIP